MRFPVFVLLIMVGLNGVWASAQVYDFSVADAHLESQLPVLNGNVAVIMRQDGREIYRYQAGVIDHDTLTRMASFTKTVSAAVILSLVEDDVLTLDEQIGDALPLFATRGIGDFTVLDAWSMRHGIETAAPYEHDDRYTLAESVNRIGLFGYRVFPAGTMLGYDGSGMQTVGYLAEQRVGQPWETIARTRILNPCQMPLTDYKQFDPNPAIAGGLRSTPNEAMNFLQMIIDGGWFNGQQVLSMDSIEQLYTNETRGLPVHNSPFPDESEYYPYGAAPDYAFGCWVIAENPRSQHVEEVVGAGAWGSYLWLDRRRGITAVLFTDVPPGSRASFPAAMGLFAITRQTTEARQVPWLGAAQLGSYVHLAWQPVTGSVGTRIYGADAPIRDIYDLWAATFIAEVAGNAAVVPVYAHYAATAVLPGLEGAEPLENTALIPGGNALDHPTPKPDLDDDALVGWLDYALLESDMGNPGPAAPGDVDRDGDCDVADLAPFQTLYAFNE